ncbi:MAG: sulfate permease [Anaerolineales bacterium]|nr:sulfate permease [Chloroflexota bacterium]MBL7163275.1 sulfate permease [Anaerolineales bacterium]
MLNQIWRNTSVFLSRPADILKNYQLSDLRPDLVAGLTVAIVLLPQAIAYAMIAELPPQVGLYSAIVAAIIGALWGSSNHLSTGPTNTLSLLVLTTLLPVVAPGSPEYLAAAGIMAVMVGVFQLILGLARLGVLVNFVSDSVVIGFTTGAGVLIGVSQLRHLLGLEIPSHHSLLATIEEIGAHIQEIHWISLFIGLGIFLLIVLMRVFKPKWPAPLLGMVAAACIVAALSLDQQGVIVIGELPRSLPPLTQFSLDLNWIANLSSGALAVGAIGLVESIAISRSIASQSGQRLDSNQEFVGQGLSNIAAGFFSGYSTAGSFTRTGVNFDAGAKTPLAGVFSGIFVLISILIFGPLAAYVPRTALAAVLLVTAYGLVDRKEIMRILRGMRGDTIIMVVTFLATLFLPLQFAVLTGIMLSLAIYILRTSVPRVEPVLPALNFRHFAHQPEKTPCPQMAIFDILGDLYFGAVNHIEETIRGHLENFTTQRFLLLRMISVGQCDISGIHALESIVDLMRERGGDVYFMRVQPPVLDQMKSTGLYDNVGADHCLSYDQAISYMYHHVLDPAICIYECSQRVFMECQNLPKRIDHPLEAPIKTEIPSGKVAGISPEELWGELHSEHPPLVMDVREPREFKKMHIMQAQSMPLFKLLSDSSMIPKDRQVVFVCHGGRRSTRATYLLTNQGYDNVKVLRGGMLAWEAACLIEAIDE